MSGVPPLIAAMVLASALLHAAWNVLLRSGADRMWTITVMCLVSGATAAVAMVFLPAPAVASWSYAAVSAALPACTVSTRALVSCLP